MCLWIDLMNSPQQHRSVRIDCLTKVQFRRNFNRFHCRMFASFLTCLTHLFLKRIGFFSNDFAGPRGTIYFCLFLMFLDMMTPHEEPAANGLGLRVWKDRQATRRTTMSKAPRSQPCLATAAPMAKTPGRFHRFDAGSTIQAAFRIQNQSCKQRFLVSNHPRVGEGLMTAEIERNNTPSKGKHVIQTCTHNIGNNQCRC